MNLEKFVQKNKQFWWYVKNPICLDEQAIIEGVIKYGDMPEVRQLLDILGRKKVAHIFAKQIAGRRTNYDAKTINYFRRYFKHYAK
ncbi:MAG TPA: hypothetical protein PK619_01085 [bacterium]|nr:hypothetical protein [bacterium]HPN81020.1 hypothetical protein [bacterium]HPW39303.1 hypothetical protein [bacterium]